MIKLKLDDLLFLLDSKPHYDEVVCFARDLDPPELGQHVLKVELGKVTVGFAAGNCWRNVRIEEKLGIVVVSNPPDDQPNSEPSGAIANTDDMEGLHASLRWAAQATFGEPREMIERIWLGQMGFSRPIAMLRKIDGKLHRNLVMELVVENGMATWAGFQGPLHDWVKQTLWADVPSVLDEENPRCLLSNCRENWKGRCLLAAESKRTPHAATCLGYERRRDDAVGDYTPEFKRLGELVAAQQTTKPCPECGGKGYTIGSGILDGKACEACGNTGIAMTHPFPGADAHPGKRGGELCVEGTRVPVARILAELADLPVDEANGDDQNGGRTAAEIAVNLDLKPESVRACLGGLADWLKTQNWTGMPEMEWVQREIERGYRSGLLEARRDQSEAARFREAHERKWGQHLAAMDAALGLADEQEMIEKLARYIVDEQDRQEALADDPKYDVACFKSVWEKMVERDRRVAAQVAKRVLQFIEAERYRRAFDAERPLPRGSGYEAIARGRLLLALADGTVETLVGDARKVVEAKGASSVMPLEIARAILRLHDGRFDAWASIPVEKTHQQFIEEARREREALETAARAREVGKRYSAMSPEEFATLRKTADAALPPSGTPYTVADTIWAAKLSRALDVIERVTDERDRCTKARLAQMGAASESPARARVKAVQAFHGFRCQKCSVVFPADGNVKDSIVTCPGCKATWPAVPPAEEVVITRKELLAEIAKVERETGRPVLSPEQRAEAECSPARPVSDAAPIEKRCGTCGEWMVHDGKCGGCGMANHDVAEGPPWENCRFWKPKEKS